MDKIKKRLLCESDHIITKWGELSWRHTGIPAVLEIAKENNWVVLGGDVLLPSGEYAYANWYYEPDPHISLQDNVALSIDKCNEYILNYVEKCGNDYLFVLVLSDAYVAGRI